MRLHRTILLTLYIFGFAFAGAVAVKAFGYYGLPVHERPHSELHAAFKPGGVWGHGLGILGSTMMLLLFLYSARKRGVAGLRFGRMSRWLNVHIFFGIMGPVFVTLHTALKFGGIVSVSYFSMVAVMLSGFIGRYLYVQIPRALSGDELTLKQMEEKNAMLNKLLVEEYNVSQQALRQIGQLAGVEKKEKGGFRALGAIVMNDLRRPLLMRNLRRQFRARRSTLPAHELGRLLDLVNEKALLVRRMTFLATVQSLFHYWHVAHKPFAYVMIIIMFVHIGVTLLFGFRWIF